MNYFETTYTVLGGLGIFFLGLLFLSEALQASGRDAIRRILARATSNRIVAVLAGIGITAFVQSSSITTVMTVSIVNAGLMELRQALGIIIGANIGTTITGWIISIKVGSYGLLFVGLGILPMLAAQRSWIRTTGKSLVALGLVFIGLEFMGDAFRPLRTDPNFISYLYLFDAQTLRSLISCVLIGCVLTMIVQSSSAMLGITITLASTGVIDFDTAVGLIIGENIGTTITAQLASIGTSTAARRAARGHAIFNVLGAVVMIIIFPWYVQFIDAVVGGEANFTDANGDHPYIAFHIAVSHTMFNVINVLLWIPFLDQLNRLVCWLVPQKDEKEAHKLKYLGNATVNVPEVGLQEAELELGNMIHITNEMLRETREYMSGSKHRKKPFKHIQHMEEVTDRIEEEMIKFLTRVQTSEITDDQAVHAYNLVRKADEIESIADCLLSLSIYRFRLFDKEIQLSDEAWLDLLNLYDQISEYFRAITTAWKTKIDKAVLADLLAQSETLTEQADSLRHRHIQRLAEGTCEALPAQMFNDITMTLRRVKNHAANLLDSVAST